MTAFVCERCSLAFEAEEARCPKCLRKSSVRDAAAPVREAAEQREAAQRTLRTGLTVLAAVISGLGVAALASLSGPIGLVGQVLVALGAALGVSIAVGVAPREAVEQDHPGRAFVHWLGVAVLASISVPLSGLLADWMIGTISTALAVVLGVVFWLGMAVPLRRHALGGTPGPAQPRAGKWR